MSEISDDIIRVGISHILTKFSGENKKRKVDEYSREKILSSGTGFKPNLRSFQRVLNESTSVHNVLSCENVEKLINNKLIKTEISKNSPKMPNKWRIYHKTFNLATLFE